jgi:predicted metal-dependent hydrolase
MTAVLQFLSKTMRYKSTFVVGKPELNFIYLT